MIPRRIITLVGLFSSLLITQSISAQKGASSGFSDLAKTYHDESHCLTLADMRGDKDMQISCFCRDAVADARYVYFTYILTDKDPNLRGVYLLLEGRIRQQCGQGYDAIPPAMQDDWKWNGPEVVRTYSPDKVIERIAPETRDGKPVGRWVPFTVQLVYRDDHGHITRTETYSSRELLPVMR